VRGACREPAWHGLRDALEGPDAFHELYPGVVVPEDLPFAEDALGDQFLLREGAVLRLVAETGDLLPVSDGLEGFFGAVLAGAPGVLGVEPLLAYLGSGRKLEPGQLLTAYPPFVMAESRDGVDLRPLGALERRRLLAALARQVRDLPDGAEIQVSWPIADR
jgi:hypothetical protein